MGDTSHKTITVIIPCYNEEAGIRSVIERFPRDRLARFGYRLGIIVVDNNSTDRTGELAAHAGATVLHESCKGKGNALRRGFAAVPPESDYVVMIDGDATYRPEEVLRLIEPLESGFCSVVVGSRLAGRIAPNSMTAFNRLGNWVFAHLVRLVYQTNVTDVLSGYFAWTRRSLERLHPLLTSPGFAIEMEMVTKLARLGEEVYAVPISYDARAGQTNLHPIWDGFRVLTMFLRTLAWRPRERAVPHTYIPPVPDHDVV